MQRNLLQLFYLLSAILFVMGLRGLSHPKTARRGMFLAEFGMLLAIVGTLLHHEIIGYKWIAAGLVLARIRLQRVPFRRMALLATGVAVAVMSIPVILTVLVLTQIF